MVPTVLLCYDSEDKKMVDKLRKHLSSLVNTQRIVLLDAGNIDPGLEWKKEVNKYLNQSQIILLAISPSFLSSIEHWEIEMSQSIDLYEEGKVHVIPVILRPVTWEQLPIYKLKALPDPSSKPVCKWHPRDEGYKNVAIGISEVVEQWNTHSLTGTIGERRILMANLDTFIEAVRSHLEPPPRGIATASTLEQLSVLIPNDVTLADLALGWQILSRPSGQQEEIAVERRRITCGELAKTASQFTTEPGNLSRAIDTWLQWVKAFKNNNGDKRQVSMLVTFTRELAELRAIANS